MRLYPETKKGAFGGGNNGKGTKSKTVNAESAFTDDSPESFTENTSKQTGKSKRTILVAVFTCLLLFLGGFR